MYIFYNNNSNNKAYNILNNMKYFFNICDNFLGSLVCFAHFLSGGELLFIKLLSLSDVCTKSLYNRILHISLLYYFI